MKPLLEAILHDLDTAQSWELEEENHQAVAALERAIEIVKYHFKLEGIYERKN